MNGTIVINSNATFRHHKHVSLSKQHEFEKAFLPSIGHTLGGSVHVLKVYPNQTYFELQHFDLLPNKLTLLPSINTGTERKTEGTHSCKSQGKASFVHHRINVWHAKVSMVNAHRLLTTICHRHTKIFLDRDVTIVICVYAA